MKLNKKGVSFLAGVVLALILLVLIVLFILGPIQNLLNLGKENISKAELKACEEETNIYGRPILNIVNCDFYDCSEDEIEKWQGYLRSLGSKNCAYLEDSETDKSKQCNCIEMGVWQIVQAELERSYESPYNHDFSSFIQIPNIGNAEDFVSQINNIKSKFSDKLKKTIENLGNENLALVYTISIQNNVDPLLTLAIITQESLGVSDAKSGAGALGLMQLMPKTASGDLGLSLSPIDERLDPAKNIDAGTRYLKLLEKYTGSSELRIILGAYNAGAGNVKNKPESSWPSETKKYVPAVIGFYSELSKELTNQYSGNKDWVSKAYQEYLNWNSGNLKETQSAARPLLDKYWRNVGRSTYHPSNDPWSGAFISYVVNDLNGALHSTYINNVYHGKISNWKFYKPSDKSLSIGDIVCATRDGGVFNPNSNYKSHCDIVYSIDSNSVKVLGGNVDDTVKMKTISLNNGKISSSAYFAVLSVE